MTGKGQTPLSQIGSPTGGPTLSCTRFCLAAKSPMCVIWASCNLPLVVIITLLWLIVVWLPLLGHPAYYMFTLSSFQWGRSESAHDYWCHWAHDAMVITFVLHISHGPFIQIAHPSLHPWPKVKSRSKCVLTPIPPKWAMDDQASGSFCLNKLLKTDKA
jgi:hypothetical protein